MNNALEDECDDKKRLVRRLQVTRFQQKVLFVPMGSRGLGILMCCLSLFLLFRVYLSAVGFESIGKGQGPRTRAFVGRSIDCITLRSKHMARAFWETWTHPNILLFVYTLSTFGFEMLC